MYMVEILQFSVFAPLKALHEKRVLEVGKMMSAFQGVKTTGPLHVDVLHLADAHGRSLHCIHPCLHCF